MCVCVCVSEITFFHYSRKRSAERYCNEKPELQGFFSYKLPSLRIYNCLNHLNVSFLAFAIKSNHIQLIYLVSLIYAAIIICPVTPIIVALYSEAELLTSVKQSGNLDIKWSFLWCVNLLVLNHLFY